MDNVDNPNTPNQNPTPPPNFGGPPPPPAFSDPEPPAYGDPIAPSPEPSPATPLPGLSPVHPSPPNPPEYHAPADGAPTDTSGSLTNPSKDERNWAMFAHLSAIAAALVLSLTSIPAFGFIGPLIIYLMKKDESPFIAQHAKEALNFNISVGIVLFAMWFLALILVWTIIVPIIMIALTGVVGSGALVMIIIAAIKASNGESYSYPFTLRLID